MKVNRRNSRKPKIENYSAERTVIFKFQLRICDESTIFLHNFAASEGIAECEVDGGNLMPQILLFIAQLVSGVGHSLLSTLGISYIDE